MNSSLKEKKRVASQLQPSVRIGRSGLTSAVIDEIRAQLKKKEAVKVKILGAGRTEVKKIASELAERCPAELVDTRGNTVVLWKIGKTD